MSWPQIESGQVGAPDPGPRLFSVMNLLLNPKLVDYQWYIGVFIGV